MAVESVARVNVNSVVCLKLLLGMTLVELMVVIAIVSLLVTIAVPSYEHIQRKTRRKEAEQSLQLLRQAMERHYAKRYSYRDAAESGDTGPPRFFAQQVPFTGTEKVYDLSISRAGEKCFELKAIPVEDGRQINDPCGTLVLNHAGERGSDNIEGQCWNLQSSYQELSDEDCEAG